ncbi:alpha/beta hydrolase family protein [Anaerococcus sp.]|uniref:alpha/beta hydrolase family protein n=1 Tax=Anaerococcus sp. TaxID=1872515 RepID=UPI00258C8943|nr:S9 family peptidase [Anaerococcus sp.]MDU3211111.1 S9 family peptidase [Anaerococcus sp.]
MSKTKIKDILAYDFLSELHISDDGNKLAYKKTNANYDNNKYESDLWIYDTNDNKNYPVTNQKNASIFTFNKDSNFIYKVKSEEDKDIFNIIDGPGVGKKAFEIKKDVSSIKWLKKDLFLVRASEKNSKEEKDKEKENKYFEELTSLPFWNNGSSYVKDHKGAYYLYNNAKNELKKITNFDLYNDIYSIDLNKDNSKAIYIRTRYDKNKVMELYEDLILLDIKTGKEKIIIENSFSYFTANFIENKIIFVATDMKKGGVNEDSFIYVCDYDGNYEKITDKNFDMAFGNSLGTDVRFGGSNAFTVENNRLYFVVTEKETTKLYSIDINGNLKKEINAEVEDFAIKNNELYYLSMEKDTLSQLKKKDSDEILLENKIETKLGKIETFEFESNGDNLIGFVLLPTNFDKSKKYPTILSVHGGPKTEFSHIFHHEHQVLANDGYIVIYTNPHGSSGNGVKFSDIRGRYGDVDYNDLMKFVDIAIEKYPQIDNKNLGVYGGSYGGFMTNWIIGHTDRFKAACSQRSISNWTSFYGVSDIGYYFGLDQTNANPWDSLEKMWDQSPIKYADKAKTPTLFIHSDEDYRCPLEQGLQMYNKLKLNGVDTKMYVFHGENHELSRSGKPHARIKRLKEIKKWFDGYLK